jgi:NADH-quinone oxidoreductase subunit L
MSVLPLIPLLPVLACLLVTVAGRRLGEASHRVGIPAVALSFLLSVAAFVEVLRAGPQSIDLYRFIEVGTLAVDLGLYADQLTVVLLLLVTGVSTIVHVYASRYMIGDPRYPRFFAVIALFTAAMILLVMSRNLLMTYMCWEAMGICSYLLISHWGHRAAAGRAATKAFLVNAVADVGFGCAVLLTFRTFGTLDIPTVLERAAAGGAMIDPLAWAGLSAPLPAATMIALLLFVGALGKSAQVPMHVWLPFAMEAPTPVSALIHAATMVNAGPFLLIRMGPLLVLSPVAMGIIAAVGATTALFAALVSATQSDIKKILAYSTISQIGFMIMMCGVGAFAAALFHLVAHGFLKAFLFLSTGNALAAVTPHHEPEPHPPHDAPATGPGPRRWELAAGTLLFACVPPLMLFSGPYGTMWTRQGTPAAAIAFQAIALATIFLTAMYLARGAERHFRHQLVLGGTVVTPRFLSLPHTLIVVGGALVLTALLFEIPALFTAFLAPALPPAGPSAAGGGGAPLSWVLALAAAAAGWAVATFGRPVAARRWAVGLYVFFWNKGYFDEIYDRYIVAPNLRLARGLAAFVERTVVDGVLNLLGSMSLATARWLWRVLEGRGIDRAVSGTAQASMGTARWLWRVLEGRGFQEGVDRVSHQAAGTVGRLLQQRELHTLQEHLLLVLGGLALLLVLFYLSIRSAT